MDFNTSLDTFSYVVAGVATAGALAMAIVSGFKEVRRLQKAGQGAITFRLRGDDKSVTLPAHYSERAVRELSELVR